jgi:hypothetical protein
MMWRNAWMSKIGRMINSFRSSVGYCFWPEGTGDARPGMVTLWGLFFGLILCGVFAWSWKFFGDLYFSEYSRLRVVPIALVVLTASILNFKQLLGLAVTVDRLAGGEGENSQGRGNPGVGLAGQVAVILVILLKFSALLAMPYHAPWWPGDWRRIFNPLYPVMHYRVLILLGLWGKTGMLIAGATGPTSPEIGESDRALRRKLTIRSLLGNLVFTFLITTVYFSSWRNRAIGILVSFIIFLIVYLVSMIVAWRTKGHDRYSMFACGEIGEVLLLFSYLAVSRFL